MIKNVIYNGTIWTDYKHPRDRISIPHADPHFISMQTCTTKMLNNVSSILWFPPIIAWLLHIFNNHNIYFLHRLLFCTIIQSTTTVDLLQAPNLGSLDCSGLLRFKGLLIVLNGFEQLWEVSLAEPAAAALLVLLPLLILLHAPNPLDYLQEKCWPVWHSRSN